MKKLLLILFAFILSSGMVWGQTTIAYQGFEGSSSDTWSYTSTPGVGTIAVTATKHYVGTHSLELTGSDKKNSDPYIILNNIDISGYTSVTLSVAFAADGPDGSDDLYLDISYDNGSTWNGDGSVKLVDGYNNCKIDFGETSSSNPTTVSSNPWTVAISDAKTQISVRIRFNERSNKNNTGDHYYVDDIKLTGIASSGVNNPSDFDAATSSTTQIDLSWTQNSNSDNVMVAWSSDGTFGTPTDGTAYAAGDPIPGGGTVLYNGSATSYSHTGLTPGTHYYYKAWSVVNGSNNYSSGVTADASTANNLIISEVADPEDYYHGRFVELYNLSNSAIDLGANHWYLTKEVNGGSSYVDITLSGTIPAGGTYVVAYKNTDFNTYYHFDPDQANTGISGNGDDGYFLYYGGDHTSGTLIDAYGVLGEDGTGKAWEYKDSHAVRLPNVTGPSATWTADDWVIISANVADMTPSVYKAAFTWDGGTSSDWSDKNNWKIGSNTAVTIPDISCTVNIPTPDGTSNPCLVSGTPDFESDAYSITINDHASLTIPPGKALSVGDITNNAGPSGLIIQSDATGNGSLIVHNNSTNIDATVQRYIAGYTTNRGTGNGWQEIGCPVQNMTVASSDFEPGASDDLYHWDESASDGKNWRNYKVTSFDFTAGKGYLVAKHTGKTYNFTGKLNLNNVTINGLTSGGTGNGWQLLGNPYTSAINWKDSHWVRTNVGAVAEIWDEASASYKAISTTTNDTIIPSTNGFFVQVVSGTTGSVTIPVEARTHNITNNYKRALAKTPAETLTFKITNDANSYSDKSVFGFKPNATTGWDIAFDAHKLMSMVKAAPQIWTVSQGENFLINYVPETNTALDVPLHFHAGVNTVYHLTINGMDSFNGTDFVLEDLKTGEKIDLNNTDSYDFSAEEGDDVNRFMLHINGITAVPNTKETDGIQVFSYGNTVYLHGQKALNGKVSIFNTLGQKVYEGSLNGVAKQQISLNQRAGIYFVRVEENNHLFTQKVFIK